MKTPVRFQSRLLLRRSYKPARVRPRSLGVTFRPAPRFVVQVGERKAKDAPVQIMADADDTLSQSA